MIFGKKKNKSEEEKKEDLNDYLDSLDPDQRMLEMHLRGIKPIVIEKQPEQVYSPPQKGMNKEKKEEKKEKNKIFEKTIFPIAKPLRKEEKKPLIDPSVKSEKIPDRKTEFINEFSSDVKKVDDMKKYEDVSLPLPQSKQEEQIVKQHTSNDNYFKKPQLSAQEKQPQTDTLPVKNVDDTPLPIKKEDEQPLTDNNTFSEDTLAVAQEDKPDIPVQPQKEERIQKQKSSQKKEVSKPVVQRKKRIKVKAKKKSFFQRHRKKPRIYSRKRKLLTSALSFSITAVFFLGGYYSAFTLGQQSVDTRQSAVFSDMLNQTFPENENEHVLVILHNFTYKNNLNQTMYQQQYGVYRNCTYDEWVQWWNEHPEFFNNEWTSYMYNGIGVFYRAVNDTSSIHLQ